MVNQCVVARSLVVAAVLAVTAAVTAPAAPALALADAAAAPPARGAEPAAVAPKVPPLVVVVVDQLAAWIADERFALLPEDGGFARLRREGLYVRDLRFAHAPTDTAPGHSALFTGAVPRESGILANEIILPAGGDAVSFLSDPETKLIGAGSVLGSKAGSSLRALRVPTLADELMALHPEAQVISLSLKDRGALFGGGRRPAAVIWFDPDRSEFVTSTAFARAFPEWAVPFANPAAVTAAMKQPWTLGDPAWVKAHAQTDDDAEGEAEYQGLGKTFPHPIGAAKALRATPAGDTLLFGLAEAAAAQLARAQGAPPALLAVSLSSHDYVAHLFGPHSWEAWDELAKLDRRLAVFLARLDALFGPSGYSFVLTADHGSNALPEQVAAASPWCRQPTRTPERWQRACGLRHRLNQPEIVAELETVSRQALGGTDRGPLIAGIADPLLYFTPAARALAAADRRTLIRVVSETLQRRFGLAHVVELSTIPAKCPPLADESWAALVCRSVRPEGPGDLYLVVAPGSFFDPRMAVGSGTSHGSPYLYDRSVPLLVRAPGRVRPGQVLGKPTPFTAFTRTAAALLKIPPPKATPPGPSLIDRAPAAAR